jgi:hypothetical protein
MGLGPRSDIANGDLERKVSFHHVGLQKRHCKIASQLDPAPELPGAIFH